MHIVKPCGHFTEWNAPVTGRQILLSHTFWRCLESSELERRVVEAGVCGRGTRLCLMGTEFRFCKMKSPGEGQQGWWRVPDVFSTTEQYP